MQCIIRVSNHPEFLIIYGISAMILWFSRVLFCFSPSEETMASRIYKFNLFIHTLCHSMGKYVLPNQDKHIIYSTEFHYFLWQCSKTKNTWYKMNFYVLDI